VLWSLSRVHPPVRKYLRATVLPPLTAKDIQASPSLLQTFSNSHLCSFFQLNTVLNRYRTVPT
jgi:hypothetical protein